MKGQSHKALAERLKVLKTAWVFGNGEVPQPWFKHHDGIKKNLISHIHSAFAAFAAVPSVKLPVGLQETIMAEDFDFDWCLAKFDLSWTKATKVLQKQSFKSRASYSPVSSAAKLKGQSNKARLKEQQQEQKRVAKLKEQKQKNRAIKRKKQKLLVLGFNPR